MNIDLEYAAVVAIKKVVPEVLEIKQDHINVLGIQFLILMDDEGNFTKIKNIRLDETNSLKLTQLLWNFAFVHLTVQRSRGQFGHADASIKINNILKKIRNKLKNCKSLCDIKTLVEYMETEGLYINNLL